MSDKIAPREGMGLDWKFAMEVIILTLDQGTSTGKLLARRELRDLAKRLDALNAEA